MIRVKLVTDASAWIQGYVQGQLPAYRLVSVDSVNT
jgi:hypothetical protein